MPARAEFVLEAGIDPLDLGTGLEAFGFMRGEVDLLPATRVVIDQRHVVQIAAVLAQERAAIRGIHHIVEVDHARSGQRGQRDGHLRIVNTGAGDHGADGNLAVGDIQTQLVADPGGLEALAVGLAADVAGARQVGQHRAHAHALHLALDAGQYRRANLALARTPSLARRWRDDGRLGGDGFLACLNLGGVARDVADQLIAQLGLDQGRMRFADQALFGQLGKGTRKQPCAGQLAPPIKTAQSTQASIHVQALDQGDRGRQAQHRLGHERTGQRRPFACRASHPAATGRHETLDLHHLPDAQQLLKLRCQLRAQASLGERHQLVLKRFSTAEGWSTGCGIEKDGRAAYDPSAGDL